MAIVEELQQSWESRVQRDCPGQPSSTITSIITWLMGEDQADLEQMPPEKLAILGQAMDYRYRILIQRYLGLPEAKGYNQLIQRLGSLFLIRNKIKTWVSLSRDRRRSVIDVLQEVIQEMIQSDRHIQHQIRWIAQCTTNPRLRNALMLTSIEEYCLRPIRNQPLLVYRFVNYLRRTQRGGMTQVPTGDIVRLVSEEVTLDDSENPISLLDDEAIAQYQDTQHWEDQQALRSSVKAEFVSYLEENVSTDAAQWLDYHLQGKTQEAIAQLMDLDIRQVYRLREKISYHAIRVFSLKSQPELVTSWLGTSLTEHSLGLTPNQWETFWNDLTPNQQHLITQLQAGKTIDEIARDSNTKANQVMSEWSKVYLASQTIRGAA
ncbi:MAG: HetZ-related protein 2 [Leptolyngbyaceae bacterium]|nr:HetZ-related protein 2 [Leptolyngbyaceae bacterium]